MADERISVDKANHVATFTLNRPEKHNAFDGCILTRTCRLWVSAANVTPQKAV
jgi:enoyl-CoA hydratase/carnithine racemase